MLHNSFKPFFPPSSFFFVLHLLLLFVMTNFVEEKLKDKLPSSAFIPLSLFEGLSRWKKMKIFRKIPAGSFIVVAPQIFSHRLRGKAKLAPPFNSMMRLSALGVDSDMSST